MAQQADSPPVPKEPERALVAGPPVIDRYPTVIGASLTGQYLSAAYRLCATGWRYQYVDLINELLEHDPHTRGVARQRLLSVAAARVSITAPKLPKNHPDFDLAQEVAESFQYVFESIPARVQALHQLNWGVAYGLGGAEISWERTDEGWEPVELANIHSRRLNFSDPTSWDLYIYDQGLVGPGYYMGPTTGPRGLRVADFPGKFIIHAPALNGDYPTRDGEARYVGFYMLLKRMVVRATSQDFERVIRPWVVAYFNRERKQGEPPIATKTDIEDAESAAKALGAGALNSVALPDSVKIEILRAVAQMNAGEFLSFLNREISKGWLGQAFTTEPGANGNFATATVAEKATLRICQYDGHCLGDTLKRDLAGPWFRLNYPGLNRKLCPDVDVIVESLLSPDEIMKLAAQGTSIDMPVDIDRLGTATGLPLVGKTDEDARRTRMVAAGKGETPAPKHAATALDVEPGEDEESGGDERPSAPPNATNGRAPAQA